MVPHPIGEMNKRGLLTIAVVFGGLFVVFFGFSAVMLSATGTDFMAQNNKVGVVEVIGPIMDSKKTVASIRKFTRDETIKAIVVRVDSPGGSVGPSQEIYDAVKKAKELKPLVVSMGGTAASGGYYIACGADKVYANPGTITGSIGVITQFYNVSPLLEKAQVSIETVTSGPYKDSGSPFRQFTEKDRAYFQEMVDDVYEQFIEDVAAARKIELEEARRLADGRVYTGRQAKKYKLVDELGSMQDAVDYVAKEAKLEGEPALVYPPSEESFLNQVLASSVEGVIDTVKARTSPAVEYRWAAP